MLRIFFLISFLLLPLFASAQTEPPQRFIARGEPVEDVLKKVVDTYSIDLVYDPEFDLLALVFVDIVSANPSEVLREVLKNTSYDFIILSTGTYVITERKGIIQQFGSFVGYVLDKETGQPIPNASILFADASVNTFTNKNGFFSVSPLSVGEYPVTVSSLGYAPSKTTIMVDEDSEVNVIRLSPSTIVGDPIIVNTSSLSLSNNKIAENLDVEDLRSIGSGQHSIVRSLSFFSGVSFNYAQDELSIQGGDPSNYLIRLDGATLYNTSRSANMLGMFSPYAIDKVSIQRAAYDASYGGSLSGTIDFDQTLTDRSSSNQLVQADPNSLNLRSEVVLEELPLKISATGRIQQLGINTPYGFKKTYNAWNQLDPLLQNFLMSTDGNVAHYDASVQDNEIGFNDFHIVAEYKPDPFSTTTFSGYYGNQRAQTKLLSSRLTLASTQPDFVYSQEDSETYNLMGQVSHYRILGSQTDIFAQVYFSSSKYSNIYYMDGHTLNSGNPADSAGSVDSPSAEQVFRIYQQNYTRDKSLSDINIVNDLTFKSELTQYFSSQNRTRFGLELKFIDYNFELRDLFYFPTNNNTQFGLITGYATNRLTISRNFWLEAGLRSTFITSTQNVYLLPRASITFDSEKTNLGYHTINVRAGVYRQFFNQYEIANVGPSAITQSFQFSSPVDESIDTPVSYQTGFSWSLMPSDQFRISLDGFFKSEPRSYEINFVNILTGNNNGNSALNSQSEFLSPTSMRAYGGALSLDMYFRNPELHLKMVQQSNVSRQKIEERFNNDWNHTSWSEPFSSSAFVNWRATKNLSFMYSMKWTPVRYWAFDRAYYDFLTTHNESQFTGYDFNKPDELSLEDYFRIDIGVNYSIPIKGAKLSTRIDLINLTNRKNEVSYHLNPVQSTGEINYQLTRRTLNGFLPTASLQVEF